MEHGIRFPIQFVRRAPSTVPLSLLQEHAARRIAIALRGFESVVRRVTVRVTDDNGPRRGIDTRCLITVHLGDGNRLLVHATSAWPMAAIADAAKRLSEMLRRRIHREHTRARKTTHRQGIPAAAGS